MKQPGYYAILPANVRYSKDLSPMQKIMYAEITALSNQHGFCTAGNSYFANLYEVDNKTVGRWIKSLEQYGFIDVERDPVSGHNRTLSPRDKKITPPGQKDHPPRDKKITHNNTSIILQDNNNTPPVGVEPINDDFEEFWEQFANKKEKKKSLTAWKRLSKAKRRAAIAAIPAYKAYLKRTGYSQMYPTTWINGERWTDDFSEPKAEATVVTMQPDSSDRLRKIREEIARREATASAHG